MIMEGQAILAEVARGTGVAAIKQCLDQDLHCADIYGKEKPWILFQGFSDTLPSLGAQFETVCGCTVELEACVGDIGCCQEFAGVSKSTNRIEGH